MNNYQQEAAIKIMQSGRNVALIGEGGVGKTYCIKEYVRLCHQDGKRVIVSAPTGCAAANISGMTNHSAFEMPWSVITEKPKNVPEALLKTDVVIIDEISMVRRDQFAYISKCIELAAKTSKRSKQLIVVGDFYQLPPVIYGKDESKFIQLFSSKEAAYAFCADEWKKWEFAYPELTLPMRQADKEFLEALHAIRCVDEKRLTWAINYINSHSAASKIEDAISLCGRNDSADKINFDQLRKLPGEAKTYRCMGDCSKMTQEVKSRIEECLYLKVGAKVIVTVNNSSRGYFNGKMGHIKDLEDDTIQIQFKDGVVVTMERHIFSFNVKEKKSDRAREYHVKQFPIRLAYAVTIHKSQGMTFESINLDPYAWTSGQLYVALSRVKSLRGLYLKRLIEQKYILRNDIVKRFYSGINTIAA